MGGERAQAGDDALLVADVGVHPRPPAQARRGGRHRQPGLRHQGQQADRLEDNRLAPRVRPGDHQGPGGDIDIQVERHRLRLLLAAAKRFVGPGRGVELVLTARCHHPGDQQRMPCPAQRQLAIREGRANRLHQLGEPRCCLAGVERDNGLFGRHQCAAGGAHVAGEIGQKPLNLPPLGEIDLDHGVLLVDEFEGLDVQRLAGRRGVVHNAGKGTAAPGPHRHDVATAALRDEPITQHAVEVVALDHVLERLQKARPHLALLAAQRR